MPDDDDDGVDLGFELEGDDDDGDANATATIDKAAITKRHRQEEQQLRAEAKQKIFGIPKGDKAARQAAEEERDAALEAMRQRHAAELGEDPAVESAVAGVASLGIKSGGGGGGGGGGGKSAGGGGKKKSKSQKRDEAERAREQRIADTHAGAGPSQREEEMKKLNAQLGPLGLALCEIPADGHCLYRSLAHQLQLGGDPACDFQVCRREIANHMRAHANDFLPFLAETGATDIESYCAVVEGTNEWGGQLEITALAHARRACVTVYSADAPPLTTGDEYAATGTKIELAYHRHYYGLGEHYNAIVRA